MRVLKAAPDRHLADPCLPFVGLPTTSGSGTEVKSFMPLLGHEQGWKRPFSGARLFPQLALVDPDPAAGLPRDTTLSTGLDTLVALSQSAILMGLVISQTRAAVRHAISYSLIARFGLPPGAAYAATMGTVAP